MACRWRLARIRAAELSIATTLASKLTPRRGRIGTPHRSVWYTACGPCGEYGTFCPGAIGLMPAGSVVTATATATEPACGCATACACPMTGCATATAGCAGYPGIPACATPTTGSATTTGTAGWPIGTSASPGWAHKLADGYIGDARTVFTISASEMPMAISSETPKFNFYFFQFLYVRRGTGGNKPG